MLPLSEATYYRMKKDILNFIYDLFILDGDKILFETITRTSDESHDIKYVYAGNDILGLICDGNGYFFIKNTQHDIIGIVNESGSVIAKYVYDAWGNHIVCNPNGTPNTMSTFIGNINPFRYRGYYYDFETGLFWCNSRYYNPEWGRWISPDSIEYLDPSSINGLNLYAYCGNDPVNYYDPSGCIALEITLGWGAVELVKAILIALGVVVAAGTVVAIGDEIINNSDFSLDFKQDYLILQPNDDSQTRLNSQSEEMLISNYSNINLYNIMMSSSDPYGRPGQKKQGRELKNKARERFTQQVKFRGGRKPPKKHTPGRGHKKYLWFLLWRYLQNEFENWWYLD